MAGHVFASDRYDRMTYRRCGRTGLKLPEVSLGLWQGLCAPGSDELCQQVCFEAFDHGVTHVDLANNYGQPPGQSEQMFGRILRQMPRDELIVSTKAGFTMWPGPYGDWGSRKYLLASLDQSLARLGLDYVDIFYHHRPDPETPLDESLGALEQAVRQGKALYVGVSNYPGDRFRDALAVLQHHDWAPLTIHQAYYNMLGRGIEGDLLPHTVRVGTGVIAFCPLAQGVLTDRYLDGLPADSRRGQDPERGKQWYQQREQDGTWTRVRALNDLARARGQTLAQMALRWILRDERITSVLIGVSKLEQLRDNLAALDGPPLSEEELAKIETILA